MQCSACSTENPPLARFCLECGTPQPRKCSGCGADLPLAAKFCSECGRAVAAAARATEMPPGDRDGLQGERKHVTILFADVVGSTAMIRGRDEEDAQRLLDGAVQLMVDAVHRYEGTVSRRMGDGMMAMFGAPIAHEDHAARACFAALAMLEAERTYAEVARRNYDADVQIRIGLNSGGVIVRLISDDRHLDYTAMGETVHLASRMEQLAEPGTALLSPSTLALVEGYVEVRPLGLREVKGFDAPVAVAELVGAGEARTRLQAMVARGLTPFV